MQHDSNTLTQSSTTEDASLNPLRYLGIPMSSSLALHSERLARFMDPSVNLVHGTGKELPDSRIWICAMQAANWLGGGDGKSDDHPCIDSIIRKFCIRLNDARAFTEWRDELKPFAASVLGTAVSPEVTRKREFMCADWAIRMIAPMAFEFWAEMDAPHREQALEWANKLRAVAPVVDEATAEAGRAVAKEARDAAATVRASVAYAAAAAIADGAYAKASTSAASAAKVHGFRRALWDSSINMVQTLIEVTLP